MSDDRERPNASFHGSGNGGQDGYKVEVRTTFHEPMRIDDFVIDGVWREWPFSLVAKTCGVQVPVSIFDRGMMDHGLLPSRTTAEAHRWLLLASLEAARYGATLGLETRLVRVRYSWTYSTKEEGVTPGMPSFLREHGEFAPRAAPDADEKDAA